jgi:hypothetical protein
VQVGLQLATTMTQPGNGIQQAFTLEQFRRLDLDRFERGAAGPATASSRRHPALAM